MIHFRTNIILKTLSINKYRLVNIYINRFVFTMTSFVFSLTCSDADPTITNSIYFTTTTHIFTLMNPYKRTCFNQRNTSQNSTESVVTLVL